MSEKTVSLEMVKKAGVLLKQEHEARLEFEKQAQALSLEKRAMKIAFREVELGFAEPYTKFEDLMEKVATLLTEDLDVVEKALEKGYGSSRRIGELAEGKTVSEKDILRNWVMNGELE